MDAVFKECSYILYHFIPYLSRKVMVNRIFSGFWNTFYRTEILTNVVWERLFYGTYGGMRLVKIAVSGVVRLHAGRNAPSAGETGAMGCRLDMVYPVWDPAARKKTEYFKINLENRKRYGIIAKMLKITAYGMKKRTSGSC